MAKLSFFLENLGDDDHNFFLTNLTFSLNHIAPKGDAYKTFCRRNLLFIVTQPRRLMLAHTSTLA